MLNIKLLDKKIIESGKKLSYIANVLGISVQYFRLKRIGKISFNNEETDILCKELNIDNIYEKEEIFFGNEVDKNGNINT